MDGETGQVYVWRGRPEGVYGKSAILNSQSIVPVIMDHTCMYMSVPNDVLDTGGIKMTLCCELAISLVCNLFLK